MTDAMQVKEALLPPFELYDEVNIADANGHLCSCDSPELAKALFVRLCAPSPAALDQVTVEALWDVFEKACHEHAREVSFTEPTKSRRAGFDAAIRALLSHPAPTGNAPKPVAWIDQNHQIDRYGVALMMISEGHADPAGFAKRILSEFGYTAPASNPQEAVEIDDGSYTDDPRLADRLSSTERGEQ